jgi:hypothetical protein
VEEIFAVLGTKAFDDAHDFVAETLVKVGSLEAEGVEDGGTAVGFA